MSHHLLSVPALLNEQNALAACRSVGHTEKERNHFEDKLPKVSPAQQLMYANLLLPDAPDDAGPPLQRQRLDDKCSAGT